MTEKRNMFHRLLGRALRSVSIVTLIVVVLLSSLVLLPQAKAVQAAGLSYFVDATSGSDANDGRSEAKAWKTIAKVNAVSFAPGDQILFKRGETWKETLRPISSGTSGSPIVFGSYGTGVLPVLDGENARMNVVGSGRSYLTFQELDCRNGNVHGLFFDGRTLPVSTNIILQDCTISGSPNDGIKFYSGQYLLVQHCTVSNCGGTGINFKDVSHSRAHHNVCANMDGGGIDFVDGSDYNEVDGNDASACHYAGCYIGGDYNLVRNNHFHHNGPYHITPEPDGHQGEPYGIGVCESSYNEIYDNEINDNLKPGIEVYSGSVPSNGNKIYRNKFYNNAWNGLVFNTHDAQPVDNEVCYNLFYNNSYNGFSLNGTFGSNNRFHNNTVVGNLGASGRYGISPGLGLEGWTVSNNIIADNVNGAMSFHDDAITHDHNLYHQDSGHIVKNYEVGYYDTAAQITDFEATALSSDPLFVDAANHDYRLQSTSPAINAGIDVGLTTDLNGNPISGQPDIGCFESSQVIPTPVPVNPTLSGRLTKADGSGLDGVTISLSNGGGSVVTANGGLYNVTVPSSWSGKVTPSYTNGSFNPSSRDYSNITGNQTSQDYGWTAPVNPTLSGRVTQKNGAGLDGVVLTLSNDGGKVTTSGGGYYTVTVPSGWSGKVTPSYATKGVFTPSSKSYSNVTSNKISQNYSWNKK